MNKSKLIKYNLKRNSKEYNDLVDMLTSQGYRCFDAIGDSKSIPDFTEFEIDPCHLFNDQFNSDSHRLFDWREISEYSGLNGSRYYRDNAIGYYIDSATKATLDHLRANTHQCGYCGHQTTDKTLEICNKCLGSEYLKESGLYMLVMLPVSRSFGGSDERKAKFNAIDISDKFREAQELAKAQRLDLEKARRVSQANKLRHATEMKIELMRYETEVRARLLEANLPVDNLIFYSHKQEWSYGWRSYENVTKEDFEAFRDAASKLDLPELLGIGFVNLLRFK